MCASVRMHPSKAALSCADQAVQSPGLTAGIQPPGVSSFYPPIAPSIHPLWSPVHSSEHRSPALFITQLQLTCRDTCVRKQTKGGQTVSDRKWNHVQHISERESHRRWQEKRDVRRRRGFGASVSDPVSGHMNVW